MLMDRVLALCKRAHTQAISLWDQQRQGHRTGATCLGRGDSQGSSIPAEIRRRGGTRIGVEGAEEGWEISVKHGRGFLHLSTSPLLSSCCMPVTGQELKCSESHPMLCGAHSPRRGWKMDSTSPLPSRWELLQGARSRVGYSK